MSIERPLLLGVSAPIEALRHDIEMVARTDATVLVLGETGAGKELVARSLHAHSARRDRPFVAVNCGGIPETLLESELFGHTRGSFTGAYRDKPGLLRHADGGTLFLDEIGEMSLRMQAVLLRFAETGEVQPIGGHAGTVRANVRLITATNRDLRAQIAAGQFREDLYYRLNVCQLQVPALRERGDDILLLLRHYLQRASEGHRVPQREIAAEAEGMFRAYAWPGNVRELRNLAERLVVRGEPRPISAEDLPAEIRGDRPTGSVINGGPSAVRLGQVPPSDPASQTVQRLWKQLMAGEDFWTVVYQPFRAHEITRADLTALIHLGLQRTNGSYRALLKAFNLPAGDYKRFHAFLYQQNSNLAVGSYRVAKASVQRQPAGKSA